MVPRQAFGGWAFLDRRRAEGADPFPGRHCDGSLPFWGDQLIVKRLSKPDPRLKSIYGSTGALPLDNGEARATLDTLGR